MFHRTVLAACPACSCPFFTNEPACPHCGAEVRPGDGRGLQRAAASLMLGLAVVAVPLAACGDDTTGSGGNGGGSGSGGSGQTTATSTNATGTTGSTGTGDGGSGGAGGAGGGDATTATTSISVVSAYGMGANAGF
jgi:hypothetical protein